MIVRLGLILFFPGFLLAAFVYSVMFRMQPNDVEAGSLIIMSILLNIVAYGGAVAASIMLGPSGFFISWTLMICAWILGIRIVG